MASCHARSIQVRRIVGLLSASALLASPLGCGHRRASMRPAFGTPVLAAPAVVAPAGTGRTMTAEPDPGEPFLAPIPSTSKAAPEPQAGDGTGSPPVPRAAEDEPTLKLETTPTSGIRSTPDAPDSGTDGPELTRPTARPSSARGRSATTRLAPGVTSLDRVRPFLKGGSAALQPGKAERPWQYIVLHHSAGATGGYDQIDREHRKILGYEGCGYHFVIGNGTDTPDGQIEVGDRWADQKQGVHCRNGKTPAVNEYGIGICLVGNFDQAAPTPKQVAAAAALVSYLGDALRDRRRPRRDAWPLRQRTDRLPGQELPPRGDPRHRSPGRPLITPGSGRPPPDRLVEQGDQAHGVGDPSFHDHRPRGCPARSGRTWRRSVPSGSLGPRVRPVAR